MSDTEMELDQAAHVERLAKARTPGPWTLRPRAGFTQTGVAHAPFEILAEDGNSAPALVLAIAHPSFHKAHVSEANGRLLASAPDLLAASEAALALLTQPPMNVPRQGSPSVRLVGADEFADAVRKGEYDNAKRVIATGRATCRVCGSKIAKGEPAIQVAMDLNGMGSHTARIVSGHPHHMEGVHV